MPERVKIFDTTLRDGEQSPGASMNTNEKMRLAVQLEKLGVDIIEAGFPAASEGDFEAVSEIAKRVKNSEIAGLARTSKQDIDLAWGAVRHAAKPRIHTFIATSDLHLKYKLKMNREEVLNAAVDAVKYAKSLTDNVEFSAEDGSRSDRDYLCQVFGAAIEAGATTVNLPDTVGYAIPDEFAELVKYVMANTSNMHKATLSVHCHNDLGLATANTIAAIQVGARQAEVTINGIGERAGNTSMEEVVMALQTRQNLMPFETGIQTAHLYPTSRLVSMITGIMVQPNKAIVGANAFAHEAGIHQDGVLKNPMTYEIMKPETIGLSRNQLVLGKHSGRHALHTHLKGLGYDLSEDELKIVFKQFKNLADKKKHVMDEDLEALVTEGVLRTAEVFSLEYLHVTCGTTVMPMASVKLAINGRSVKGANYGNGPIDSAFNTIAQLTGASAELLRFTVSALTGGTDAQGEVTVRLRENGLVALGRGSDPDIITASAKAYINGLNRLEYLKAHPLKASQTL
ncbi:2-isopropylmalate synthase [Desulfosarcina ovata subsp. sediminis]|uniref:2-isopropylmalate synthase n=1 Tax=Desulfosarcina ovata subsp. sediminis TaxID=885957 RepID=A0A5K7ZGZ6_9BACT|nr:2-isopropylmalate synthase [Desulfosarcina ovata]BBO80121.1 2-isopropylmalate synthase [Desulfosarcina ovata subsp. sediminis]